MKAIIPTIIILCLFSFSKSFAQCEFLEDQSGKTCETAEYLCGKFLNGHTSILSDTLNQNGPTPSCSIGGSPNNIHWFSFLVCDEYVELKITPNACTVVNDNGIDVSGMQAGIYSDCEYTTELACSTDGNTSEFTLSGNGFERGTMVYMFVDGIAGSVCGYEIEVVEGIDTSIMVFELDSMAIPEDGMVMGADTICSPGIAEYDFSIPTCNGITPDTCYFKNLYEQGLICYEWSIVPDSGYVFVGDSTAAEITLEWLIPGSFTIDVEVHVHPALFACSMGIKECGELLPLDVVVLQSTTNQLPTVYLCEGESYDFCGTTYFENTTAYCETDTCEYDVQEIVFSGPQFNYLGNQFVCAGSNCFVLNGQEYCDPGSYSVQDQNAFCLEYDEFEIFDLDDISLNVTVSNDIDCNQNNATAEAQMNLNNFQGSVVFEWTGENGNIVGSGQNINISNGGSYSCQVTFPGYENICDLSGSVYVNEDTNPVVAQIEETIINCHLPTGQLNYSANMPIQYHLWQGPNGFTSEEASPTITRGGDYQVMLRGENGCEWSSSFLVEEDIEEPVATMGGPEYWYCYTENLTINLNIAEPTNFEISWSDQNGMIVNQNVTSISVNSIGIYSVEILNLTSGCSTILSHEVMNDPEMLQDFTLITEDVICFGEENGSLFIQEISGGVEPFEVYLNGQLVSEDELSLLAPGIYDMELIDANGCVVSHSTEVKEPIALDFAIDELIEVIFENNERLEIFYSDQIEVASIIWENAIGDIIGEGKFINSSFLNDDSIMVTLTDINGCNVSKEFSIKVKLADQYYVPNIFSPNADGINDYFTAYAIHSPGLIKQLTIFDRWGELLFQVEGSKLGDEQNGWDGIFKGKPLPAAVYVYEIRVNRGDGEIDTDYGSVTLVR